MRKPNRLWKKDMMGMYLWIHDNFGFVVVLGIVAFSILNIIIAKWEMNRLYYACLLVAGFVYSSILFYVTLGMRTKGIDYNYEIHLFWSYKAAFENGEIIHLWENFANVIAFLPLGMFVQELLGKRIHWYGCTFFGGLISIFIEIAQLVFKRGLFEFDDIIHNTLGVLIGVFVAWFITYIVRDMMDNMKRD